MVRPGRSSGSSPSAQQALRQNALSHADMQPTERWDGTWQRCGWVHGNAHVWRVTYEYLAQGGGHHSSCLLLGDLNLVG
jgi:hypothetical protein